MAKPFKPTAASPTPFAGLARSSSWFEMNGGKFMRYLFLKFDIVFFVFLFFLFLPCFYCFNHYLLILLLPGHLPVTF